MSPQAVRQSMDDGRLYTKEGHPIRVRDDKVYDKSGQQVGRLVDNKVYAPDGRYAATVVGDRLVYRASDNRQVSPPFVPRPVLPMTALKQLPSMILGEEPFRVDLEQVHDDDPEGHHRGQRQTRDDRDP
ncbi:hypothetical protein ABH926_006223 [Catenulispora sp. GP43]|uniref:hypothetical protein n=1 Tax=Catenulispora sp. GP43 TaxID=3156263 RepID=UPI0035140392